MGELPHVPVLGVASGSLLEVGRREWLRQLCTVNTDSFAFEGQVYCK